MNSCSETIGSKQLRYEIFGDVRFTNHHIDDLADRHDMLVTQALAALAVIVFLRADRGFGNLLRRAPRTEMCGQVPVWCLGCLAHKHANCRSTLLIFEQVHFVKGEESLGEFEDAGHGLCGLTLKFSGRRRRPMQ